MAWPTPLLPEHPHAACQEHLPPMVTAPDTQASAAHTCVCVCVCVSGHSAGWSPGEAHWPAYQAVGATLISRILPGPTATIKLARAQVKQTTNSATEDGGIMVRGWDCERQDGSQGGAERRERDGPTTSKASGSPVQTSHHQADGALAVTREGEPEHKARPAHPPPPGH